MKKLMLVSVLAFLSSNAAAESTYVNYEIRNDLGSVESFSIEAQYNLPVDDQWFVVDHLDEATVGARLYDANGSLITTIQDIPDLQTFTVQFSQVEFFQTPGILYGRQLVLGPEATIPSDCAFYECSWEEISFEFPSLNVFIQYTLSPTPVPEPGTYAMLGIGLGILGSVARRRKPSSYVSVLQV